MLPPPVRALQVRVYEAENNETPLMIAKRFDVPVMELIKMNKSRLPGLAKKSKLKPGTSVLLPVDEVAVTDAEEVAVTDAEEVAVADAEAVAGTDPTPPGKERSSEEQGQVVFGDVDPLAAGG